MAHQGIKMRHTAHVDPEMTDINIDYYQWLSKIYYNFIHKRIKKTEGIK
jgi:hypothetical protein